MLLMKYLRNLYNNLLIKRKLRTPFNLKNEFKLI